MLIPSHRSLVAPVPTGLLTAAIDFINVCRPEPQLVETTVMAFAERLNYDQITAIALATRVRATAGMFADPRWPSIRRLGCVGDTGDRARFEAVVQLFIASSPLKSNRTFDVGELRRILLDALPPHGHG